MMNDKQGEVALNEDQNDSKQRERKKVEACEE